MWPVSVPVSSSTHRLLFINSGLTQQHSHTPVTPESVTLTSWSLCIPLATYSIPWRPQSHINWGSHLLPTPTCTPSLGEQHRTMETKPDCTPVAWCSQSPRLHAACVRTCVSSPSFEWWSLILPIPADSQLMPCYLSPRSLSPHPAPSYGWWDNLSKTQTVHVTPLIKVFRELPSAYRMKFNPRCRTSVILHETGLHVSILSHSRLRTGRGHSLSIRTPILLSHPPFTSSLTMEPWNSGAHKPHEPHTTRLPHSLSYLLSEGAEDYSEGEPTHSPTEGGTKSITRKFSRHRAFHGRGGWVSIHLKNLQLNITDKKSSVLRNACSQ